MAAHNGQDGPAIPAESAAHPNTLGIPPDSLILCAAIYILTNAKPRNIMILLYNLMSDCARLGQLVATSVCLTGAAVNMPMR